MRLECIDNGNTLSYVLLMGGRNRRGETMDTYTIEVDGCTMTLADGYTLDGDTLMLSEEATAIYDSGDERVRTGLLRAVRRDATRLAAESGPVTIVTAEGITVDQVCP
jgi:hypothetical protein